MHSESHFVGKFTYKMDLGAFFIRKNTQPPVAGLEILCVLCIKIDMAGTRFFEDSHFLSTLRCGRLPAYSMYVFLRIKMHMEFILYVNLRSKN